MKKVFIDGSHGTTGLKLMDRLSGRTDIELLTLGCDYRDEGQREKLTREADIAFLCLPDDAARQAVSYAGDTVVIDTSTAHRVSPGFAYGFPELSKKHREAVAAAKRIANPGCHATGFISLAYPLVAAGAIERGALLSCFSLTGYSGGGKKMIADYEDSKGSRAPKEYALTMAHKHLPEMAAVTGLLHPPVFLPTVCDFYSGMAVNLPINAALLTGKLKKADVLEIFERHYDGCALIRVCDGGETPGIYADALAGRDDMEIYVCGNDEQLMLISLFDNLGKGASGAAIQNMNIILGAPETASLTVGEKI